MPDYPDNTRLFQLKGADITIPINIEASDVTLPVSIDAATVTLNTNLVGSEVFLYVIIWSQIGNISVNIAASAVTIAINFSDQSVAVFDAAKWFAHEADQVFLTGGASVSNNTGEIVVSRTVPAGTTFFITGMAYSAVCETNAPLSMEGALYLVDTYVNLVGSQVGHGIIFDVPIRVAAGELVRLYVFQYGSGATLTCTGSLWGWDEEA